MKLRKVWHRIKEIPWIGGPYQKLIGQRKVEYILRKQTKQLNEHGMRYLHAVEKTMEQTHALYYAYAGTLLGIVRDQRLIKWDLDIDYGVVINEAFTWTDLEAIMKANGYKKAREFEFDGRVTEQTYQIEGMTVDFFGQYVFDDKMIVYSYDRLPEVHYPDSSALSVYEETHPVVQSVKKIKVDGGFISVPENAEELLASIYTEEWRIPNPNWKSHSGNNAKLLIGKVGHNCEKT